MPQHKIKKGSGLSMSGKKNTTAKMQKVAQRKARKDGMVQKKKKVSGAQQVKANLQKAITKTIEDEMAARVGASAANTLRIVGVDKTKKGKKK